MRKALVIGIDDYPNGPLHGCVNDANAIASVLETHSNGDPNFDVKLLTSPGETLSRSVIKESVDELFQGDPDIALLYFSGHGDLNSLGGYIVSTDSKRYDEGVPMSELLKLATMSKAKEKVVILDCCFSGYFGTSAITDELATLSDGLTILTACQRSESAMEVRGKGVFTTLVVSALQGGAANLTGHVTPGSIYAYVDQALGPWEQRPIFKTNVSRFTSLRRVSPSVPIATLRKLVEIFASPEHELQLNPSYEFTNSSKQPPITVVDPEADPDNVETMQALQSLARVGLVVPVGEDHMYYAAMNSKSCGLTALGAHYWRLVSNKKI